MPDDDRPGATPEKLSRRDRLRRVVLLCTSFTRNLAYYQAGQASEAAPLHASSAASASFWRQANGNFLDICLLDWCKLLGDPKAEHHWAKVVNDPRSFETAMLHRLGLDADAFVAQIRKVRRYRDRFIAHLDNDRVMHIPLLDVVRDSAWFYFDHVAKHEAMVGDLSGLPDRVGHMRRGHEQCFAEAHAVMRVHLPDARARSEKQ